MSDVQKKPTKTIAKKSGAKKGERAAAALRKRIEKAQGVLKALQCKLGSLEGDEQEATSSQCDSK